MKCVMKAANEMKTELVTSTMEDINGLRYSEGTSNGMKYFRRKWKMRCKAEIYEVDCKWDE